MADCGLYDSEVFVDENGVYVGDFSYTDGPGGPFGWCRCTSFCEDPTFFFGAFDYFAPTTPCICGQCPQPHVPDQFGAGAARTVTDATGPAGLETVAAMEIDLPGSPGCVVTWAGPQVVDSSGSWVYGPLGGNTGWAPQDGETWVFQCWAKIVPDRNGVTVDDIILTLSVTPDGFGSFDALPGEQITLTTGWQFFQMLFTTAAFDHISDFYWPSIRLGGPVLHTITYQGRWFNDPITLVGYAPYGRVHVKCPHLYPVAPTKGNWIDSFHGHG